MRKIYLFGYTCALIAALLLSAPRVVPAAGIDNGEQLLVGVTSGRPAVEALEAIYEFEYPGEQGSSGDAGPIAETTLVRETVFYRAPDRIRLNLTWPDREEVFLAANHSTLAMVGDRATDTPWPQPFLVYRLLLESDPVRLRELLARFDFNLESLTTTDEGYVLGADTDKSAGPKAWFDKETFRLTRLTLPLNGARPSYEVVPSEYRRHDPGIFWPDRLTIQSSAGPTVRLTLRSLRANPQIEHDDFDLEKIRKTIAPAPDGDSEADAYPELKEIHRRMEWFRKKLE